nr:YlxR family protein [Microlunatus panaciterrae]
MPVRTCVGCREREQKSHLVRLVWAASKVALDRNQVAPGRGAYLHRRPECLELAIRRRAVGRALRVTGVNSDQVAQLLEPAVGADTSA